MLKELAQFAPPLFPTRDGNLQRTLKKAGYSCSASSFSTFCFFLSLFSLIPTALFLLAMDLPLFLLIPVAICVFIFSMHVPLLEAKKLENQIDGFLPLAASLCYSDLSSGKHREEALSSINAFALFKLEYEKIDALLVSGLPFHLLPNFYNSPSHSLHRFLELISSGSLAELKKFRDDLLAEHTNKVKAFTARANITGMFFISIAAIVPALFSAVVLFGNLLGFSFTGLQVLLVFCVLFPFLDFLFLYYLNLTSPTTW